MRRVDTYIYIVDVYAQLIGSEGDIYMYSYTYIYMYS